jgi:hypothetical protein
MYNLGHKTHINERDDIEITDHVLRSRKPGIPSSLSDPRSHSVRTHWSPIIFFVFEGRDKKILKGNT